MTRHRHVGCAECETRTCACDALWKKELGAFLEGSFRDIRQTRDMRLIDWKWNNSFPSSGNSFVMDRLFSSSGLRRFDADWT